MALGPNLVRVMKREDASTGGSASDDKPYPEPLNPNEDAAVSCGVVITAPGELTPTCGVFRQGNELYLFDESNPAGATLSSVLTGGLDDLLIDDDGEFLIDDDGEFLI